MARLTCKFETGADGVVRLSAAGSVGPETLTEFERMLDRLAECPGVRAVLDLGELSYINSTALGLLAQIHFTLAEDGGTLVLARAGGTVRKSLELLELHRFLPLVDSVKDGVALLRGESPPPTASMARRKAARRTAARRPAPPFPAVPVAPELPPEFVSGDVSPVKEEKNEPAAAAPVPAKEPEPVEVPAELAEPAEQDKSPIGPPLPEPVPETAGISAPPFEPPASVSSATVPTPSAPAARIAKPLPKKLAVKTKSRLGPPPAPEKPAQPPRTPAETRKQAPARRAESTSGEYPLELREVRRGYQTAAGPVEVLRGLDLAVAAGELAIVAGPSGSGKSTLLCVMGGLLRPDSGTLRVFGEELTRLSEREIQRVRQRTMGYVFQNVYLMPALTARENVGLALEIKTGANQPGAADSLLALVDMEEQAGRLPEEMSGGQRQRVGIARALAGEPRVLLADEPTAALDTKNALAVMHLLRSVTSAQGLATVVVTHDPRLFEYADRVLELTNGRIRER